MFIEIFPDNLDKVLNSLGLSENKIVDIKTSLSNDRGHECTFDNGVIRVMSENPYE